MVIKWTDSNGTQRLTEASAVSRLNLYRGKGRPRNSDYLLNDIKPEERKMLVNTIKKAKKAEKEPKKAQTRFIDRANAYIWTLVIGLYMLAVLTEPLSKIRI